MEVWEPQRPSGPGLLSGAKEPRNRPRTTPRTRPESPRKSLLIALRDGEPLVRLIIFKAFEAFYSKFLYEKRCFLNIFYFLF